MTTEQLQMLKAIVKEAVTEVLNGRVAPVFPLQTAAQVGRLFYVSRHTVMSWHKQGLLEGHYQILSGRAFRLMFTQRALFKFFDENFPSDADLSQTPFHPKSSRAQRIKQLLAMQKLYGRRRSPRK